MNAVERWRMRWERLGVPTIPLQRNSKLPLFETWNVEPPASQWRAANAQSGGWRGNLGVMPAGGQAWLDCDSPESISNCSNWLEGLGLKPPIERTPNGGLHIPLRIHDVPDTFNWAHFSPSVGKGELRARNCYLAVQCSAIDDRRYQFIRGQPEDILSLKVIKWRDITWLLAPNYLNSRGVVTELPVHLARQNMPTRALHLLMQLQNARKGEQIGRYPSRSEAEAAVVAMLILAGWSYGEITETFESWLPRHYREYKPVQREKYLIRTHEKALTHIATTPERLAIAEVYRKAQERQWNGRGGLLDRATYLALLAIAWKFSAWSVSASERVVAEFASATHMGVHNALMRLVVQKLLIRLAHATTTHATSWRIPFTSFAPLSVPPDGNNVTYGKELTRQYIELWTPTRLGRSAELVYFALKDTPLTIRELRQVTSKARGTINSALLRLEKYQLAERTPLGWKRGKATLESIFTQLECKQAEEMRHERHERERENWRENPIFRIRKERERMAMTTDEQQAKKSMATTPTDTLTLATLGASQHQ